MRKNFWSVYLNEPYLIVAMAILIIASVIMLGSIAPLLFPQYFFYIILGILLFVVFSQLSIEVMGIFNWYIYIFCILLLLLPIGIGQVTRGVIRWVQIGSFVFQPTEIVRPFLFLFFAKYLTDLKLNIKNIIKTGILAGVPILMILLQPSLGVAVLTSVGIVGIFISLDFNKRRLILGPLAAMLSAPIVWFFLQDYQKSRIINLFNPTTDPTGAGYNRIQSIIAVGSGQFSGRGLGEGIQTQLAFLPERHTDFIFASIAEEFGLIGTLIIVLTIFFILYRIIIVLEKSKNYVSRALVSAILLSMFIQIFVHIGMNMGIAPITGLPLPLVSAGGSSLIATMISLGLVIQSKRFESI